MWKNAVPLKIVVFLQRVEVQKVISNYQFSAAITCNILIIGNVRASDILFGCTTQCHNI